MHFHNGRIKQLAWSAAIAIAGLAGCDFDSTQPNFDPPNRRPLAVVEIVFRNVGRSNMVAERVLRDLTLPTGTDATDTATIQIEAEAFSSFTTPANGSEPAMRYLLATFRVRNATASGGVFTSDRSNLTFVAVSTAQTIGQTPVRRFERADGSIAPAALANELKPTGAVEATSGGVTASFPDVVQFMTEGEAAAIAAPATVTNIFPYGFVVREVGSVFSRFLPGSPAPSQFDGVVTFAFKIPLLSPASDNPTTISVMMLALDDSETRITQSLEEVSPEATTAVNVRAQTLFATNMTLLPGGGGMLFFGDERVICQVRTAGTAAAPVATLLPPNAGINPWFVPTPFATGPLQLATDVRIAAARCPTISGATTTTFPVTGQMSGHALGAYSNSGTNLVDAPAGRGGDFFPGEQIESTLTTALGGIRPSVARWRIAALGGTGSFAPLSTGVVLPRRGGHVSLFDMDNDADLDVAIGGFSGSTDILVFGNPGNGALSATPQVVAVGDFADMFVPADLDRDGDVDLAVSVNNADQLVILLNQPTGTFTVAQRLTVDRRPKGIEAADTDGDGDLDLLATSADQLGRIYLNNGSGSFVAGPSRVSGLSPFNPVAMDVDSDFDLDLVYTDANSERITLFQNDGFGQFGPALITLAGGSTQWSAAADFDGDGDQDLVVGGGSGRLTLMRNDGGAVFTPVGLGTTAGAAAGLVAADFNGDGHFDIATARTLSNGVVQLLMNNGDATFTQTLIPTGFANPAGIGAGDMDGDGDIDLVVSHDQGRRVLVLLNQ